ncbi:MAG: MBL fold metallo-hydrolase [Clostridia bacterium]|nr:MBL fold metallo-hydrolase [Clostridia bacterium]
MKITFLGTSHGVPAADRYCTSIMVEAGDNVYLLDAGAPVINLLLQMGIDLKRLKAVFISHAHMDHVAGLPDLACLMSWYFTDTSADFLLSDGEYLDMLKKYIVAADGTVVDENRVRMTAIEATDVYDDGCIKVEFIPTKHMPADKPSFAFLVTEKASGKKLFFSGDLSNRLKKEDFPEILSKERTDAFICELAHISLDDLAPHLETCLAQTVYFNHVFPVEKYEDIAALKAEKKYEFEIVAPDDGAVYEV